MNSAVFKRIKKYLLGIGILLLILAAALMLNMAIGLIALPEPLIAGESTIHSIARPAIIGCLLAAVGALE